MADRSADRSGDGSADGSQRTDRAAKESRLAEEIENLPPQDRVNMEIILLVLKQGSEAEKRSLLEAMDRDPSTEAVHAVRQWIARHPHWIRYHLEVFERGASPY